jgi:hypothetical protein
MIVRGILPGGRNIVPKGQSASPSIVTYRQSRKLAEGAAIRSAYWGFRSRELSDVIFPRAIATAFSISIISRGAAKWGYIQSCLKAGMSFNFLDSNTFHSAIINAGSTGTNPNHWTSHVISRETARNRGRSTLRPSATPLIHTPITCESLFLILHSSLDWSWVDTAMRSRSSR